MASEKDKSSGLLRRRWPFLIILVLAGGIAGAFLAPRLFNPDATPQRLKSKESAEKYKKERLNAGRLRPDGVYESKSVRIKFRTEGFEIVGDGDVDVNPTDVQDRKY